MKKFGTRLLTAVVASSMIVTPVFAAPSVDDLKDNKAAKESEVSSLQDQLTDIMSKLGDLEESLIEKGEEITKAEEDLKYRRKHARADCCEQIQLCGALHFFFSSSLRMRALIILPLVVFGSSSTKSTMRGYL